MSTQDENVLVKLVKKSVGLPTGSSSCCGAPAASTSADCCGTTASGECCGAEAQQTSPECGEAGCAGDCSGEAKAEEGAGTSKAA